MSFRLCPRYWDAAGRSARKSSRDRGLFKSQRKQEPIKKLNWVISLSLSAYTTIGGNYLGNHKLSEVKVHFITQDLHFSKFLIRWHPVTFLKKINLIIAPSCRRVILFEPALSRHMRTTLPC